MGAKIHKTVDIYSKWSIKKGFCKKKKCRQAFKFGRKNIKKNKTFP